MFINVYVRFLRLFDPINTGRKLGVQQDFQKSSRVS